MRIAFFCYPCATEMWSARSAQTGIGGSEEAVIHVSALLAARGHQIAVYNSRHAPPITTAGVTYTGYGSLRPERIDVGIVWRRAGLVRWLGGSRPRRLYLWLHDNLPFEWFAPHLGRFHKVMVLSRFHRSHYPAIPAEKLFLTSNGIAPTEFEVAPPRDPRLMVYGSSYNRGLRTLLENWGRIRAAVSDARLHIFYGWDVFQRNNPERCARVRPHFERLMTQDGITHLERIGHAEVAREYATAGVWAYPCSFPETSCISAMKAQIGGAVPAIIPTGALRETVQHGFSTMRSYTDFVGMPFPRRIINEWLQGLIDLLRSQEKQARTRAKMMPESRCRFAWSSVVDSWQREFLTR
jgi:hypothetical protein